MKQNYLMPIKGILLSGFLWLMATVAFAQKPVTGKVSDAKGEGVPGTSVALKGTTVGATSDAEGNFKINVPNAGGTLVFSSIGYKKVEVKVSSQSVVNVTLEEDAASLEEVIVTGYTTDKRRDNTGAVSLVKVKDVTGVPSGNIEQQLQGKVSGLTIITNGQPGTSSIVRIRGFGAFGGNQPLYVVDGVPVGSTDFLNPDDVESITVLKDAAAASIYGARAANGVIVYTTKKGLKGAKKLSVTYDGMYGVTNPGTGQAMMNPTDFATWTWNALRNGGVATSHPQFGSGSTPVIPDYINVGGAAGVIGSVDLAAAKLKYNVDPAAGAIYQVVRANKTGTDWYKEITRNAPISRHSFGFSGGGENSRFFVGFGAQNQDGILLNNSFTRYTFRVNTEFNVLKNLRVGENLQGTYRSVLGQTGNAGGIGAAADENDILQAFRMPSIIPVYDEFGGYAGTAAKGFNNPRNPVASRQGQANDRNFNGNGFGNVYIEYDPIPGLTVRSSLGGQFNTSAYKYYSRLQYENSENNSAFGYGEGSSYSLGWTFTNTAQYQHKFGVHGLNVLVGQEALNTGKGYSGGSSGLNPFSTDPNYINMNTVSSKVVGSNYFSGVNFSSYFGQVKYIYNDKYIITGVVRRDGSSTFGENNRYGVFPAISAAWNISSESFMKELPFVTDLKLKVGYGTMGNTNNVDPNNQYSLYRSDIGTSSYDLNGTNSSALEGYYRNRIGNPNAKWETSVTKNIGIDASLFGGKLDLILDVWQKDTKDLLFQVPITAEAGYNASAPAVNIGQMTNKGIDILLGTKGKLRNDIGYEATLTASFLDNKITYLAPGLTYITGIDASLRGIAPIRNQLGYSLSSFYGYKVVGLFQNSGEVSSAAKQDGAGPGRFRYADLNGDGIIDDKDRTYLGSPVPKFTGGFNFKITYKNFDLVAYLYTSIGNKIFNMSKWYTDFYPSFSGAAISQRVTNSWTPTNTSATIPIFETASNFSTNTQSNSFYVEDGSYLRMQNLTLGYTVPGTVLNKLHASKLRVYGSVNNIFTITGYQGLDPAVGGNADTNFGIDVGNYPLTRQFTFGLNLGF